MAPRFFCLTFANVENGENGEKGEKGEEERKRKTRRRNEKMQSTDVSLYSLVPTNLISYYMLSAKAEMRKQTQ